MGQDDYWVVVGDLGGGVSAGCWLSEPRIGVRVGMVILYGAQSGFLVSVSIGWATILFPRMRSGKSNRRTWWQSFIRLTVH